MLRLGLVVLAMPLLAHAQPLPRQSETLSGIGALAVVASVDRDTERLGLDRQLLYAAVERRLRLHRIPERERPVNGGELESLVEGIEAREQRRRDLAGQLADLETVPKVEAVDAVGLERALRAKLAGWRSLLRGDVHEARQILRVLIEDRITFTPDPSEQRVYRYSGRFTLGPLLAGVVDPMPFPREG